jgi:hypothetical protein
VLGLVRVSNFESLKDEFEHFKLNVGNLYQCLRVNGVKVRAKDLRRI